MNISVYYCATPVACFAAWRVLRFLFTTSDVGALPGPSPRSWFLGNLQGMFGPDAQAWQNEMAKKYGRVWKKYGLLMREDIFVNDPLAMHHVLVKDQASYEESPVLLEMNELLFGKGLISTGGPRHRLQRKLLNPAFSASHLRKLCPIFYHVMDELRQHVDYAIDSKPFQEIDVFSLMSLATLEGIGQGGLGHSFDVFGGEPSHSDHLQAIRGILPSLVNFFPLLPFIPLLKRLGSSKFRRWVLDHIPFPPLHVTKRLVDTLQSMSVSIYERRKNVLEDSRDDKMGKDLMSILLKANANADEKDRITDDELIGQISTFIFAGYETTSSALARILQILANDQDAQSRLREEVTKARAQGGNLLYDELMDLPYLDAVVRETLRVYPPVILVSRIVQQPVILPFSKPVTSLSGKPVSEVFLKKNTIVVVGIDSANRDPDIWGEDAEEWKPERWVGHKPEEVAKEKLPGVYSGLMTFVCGSRHCIGFKFSEIEMKIALSILLENFVFKPTERDSDIVWKNFGIVNPVLDGKQVLPLKVSKLPPK